MKTGEMPGKPRARAEALEDRVLLSASLVKDLGATPKGTFDNDSQPLVALGNEVFFDIGNALWKSDGTAAGTSLVKNLGGFFPLSGVQVGTQLIFPATDDNGEWQLWRSNGTAAGTVKLADLPAIDPNLDYTNFAVAGTNAFFTQPTASAGQFELWRSDGTAAGTIPLIQLNAVPGQFSDNIPTASLNGKLFFAATDATHGPELWTSDGTVAGTVVHDIVAGTGGLDPEHLTTAGNAVFFDNHGTGLWKSDGTTAGTALVATLPASTAFVDSIAASASGIYFRYGSPSALWHSDGTAAGTVQLVSMARNNPPDTPWLAGLGGSAVSLIVGNQFQDLWQSNGTAAGTSLVKSFTSIGELATLGATVLFAADDGTHGSELWTSNGTAAGAVLLKDIDAGSAASSPAQFTVTGGKLFFTAFDPIAGRELWVSDGSATGTKLVSDLTPGTLDFNFDFQQVAVDSTLLFTGRSSDAGLYRSDGTSAGTFQLTATEPLDLTSDQTAAYFTLTSAGTTKLWKTDGTAAGTVSLVNVPFDAQLAAAGGKVFYRVRQSLQNNVDALYAVTPFLTTPPPVQIATGNIDEMAPFNGLLYYVTETTTTTFPFTTTGYVLWKTDGTVAGTSQVATFSGLLDQLLPAGSTLYFEADDGTHYGLWTTDGTTAGTRFLSDVAPEFSIGQPPHTALLNGTLIFPGFETGAPSPQLWATDGTPGGTRLLANLMTPGGDPLSPQELTAAGGAVYFDAGDAFTNTWQLWKTDGTPAGTSMLLPDFGDPVNTPSLAALNGALYFSGTLDPTVGTELYTADSGGITLAADIAPGAASSSPDKLIAAGNTLFFTADDGVHGRELWQFSQPAQSISGRVFNDANDDGFGEASEHGLSGVTVYLDANNNGVLDSTEVRTTTDSAGRYQFTNLAPGTYTVRQILPAGYARTEPSRAFASVVVAAGRAANGPVFGDVQINTVVMDFAHLLTLAQHYGQPGTFATGDLNGDDTINFADLLLLAQNYGHALPNPAVAAASNVSLDSIKKLTSNRPRARHLL